MIANTPAPPYYSVIFSSITKDKLEGYEETAKKMMLLAEQQPGFLGVESVSESGHEKFGITVSYWRDLASIKNWKANSEHLQAQAMGKATWYAAYKTRIAKVERDYEL